jgi:drug/metabolite transporter (DMT)-like permease
VEAIGFGLVAALLWGSSAVFGGRLMRLVGTRTALAVTMSIGLVLAAPFALAVDFPEASIGRWGYAAASGGCYVFASACWLLAVKSGKVSLVTPVVSTDGAMAALIAVAAFDETLRLGVAVALAVIVAGVVTTSIRRNAGEGGHFTGRELVLALCSAVLFGLAFVVSGEAEEGLGVVWTLVTSRIVAVTLVVPAVLVLGGIRFPRAALPFAAGMAALDLAGFAAFLAGASASVAITAVLASQYAIFAVIGSFLALGERLSRLQIVGIGITVLGVAALTAARAA